MAMLSLPGGTGTLLELAAVWELKNKGFLDGGKPIILMGDFWQPLVKLIESRRCPKHRLYRDSRKLRPKRLQ